MRIELLTPWVAGLAVIAGSVLFACSDDAGGEPGTGGSDAGAGAAAATDATTAPASQAVVTNATSTTSGMNTFDCNPPAEAGSVFELVDNEVFPPFEERSMCEFRGDVLLIFNAAAI